MARVRWLLCHDSHIDAGTECKECSTIRASSRIFCQVDIDSCRSKKTTSKTLSVQVFQSAAADMVYVCIK